MLRFKSSRDQHRDHGNSSAEDFVTSLILDEVYERSHLPGSIAVLTSFFDGLVYEVSKQENNMLLSRSLEQVRPTSLLRLKVFFVFHRLNLKCRKRLLWIGTNGLLILCPNQRVATMSLVQFLVMNLEHLQSVTEKFVRQIYFEDFSCIPCMRRLLIGDLSAWPRE